MTTEQIDEELLADAVERMNANVNKLSFAESSPAAHPFGILYQGHWETLADGTGRAVRRHARALADTGVPVLLKSFNHTKVSGGILQPCYGDYDDQVLQEIGDIHHTSIGKFPLSIKHLVVTTPERLRGVLYPRGILAEDPHQTMLWRAAVAQATVLYTVWERSRIPEEIAKVMSRAGQCWVPCHQNRDCLIKSGVPADKVFVVPHPFRQTELTRAALRPGSERGSPDEVRFYAIGAWQPRKAFHELIGAFLSEFVAKGKCTLTIKTTDASWPGYPSPRESIMYWLEQPEVKRMGWKAENLRGQLSVITKTLSDEQLQDLHRNNDIYVCCSHGEAWSLPAFDAKLRGNRMVFVPWGGPLEFCDEERDVQIEMENGLGAVPSAYGWGEDAAWANFTVKALSSALSKAFQSEAIDSYYSNARTKPWEEWCGRFSSVTVGAYMRELLQGLSEKITPEAVRQQLWGQTGE